MPRSCILVASCQCLVMDTMAYTGHHPRSAKRLYTTDEAAATLGISRTRLYQLLVAGAISSVKIGRRRLFRPVDLDRWVEGLPVEQGPTGDAA